MVHSLRVERERKRSIRCSDASHVTLLALLTKVVDELEMDDLVVADETVVASSDGTSEAELLLTKLLGDLVVKELLRDCDEERM